MGTHTDVPKNCSPNCILQFLIDSTVKSLPEQPGGENTRKLTGEIISESIQSVSQPREFALTIGWLNTWHCRAYSGAHSPIHAQLLLLSVVQNSGRCGIQSGHCLGATSDPLDRGGVSREPFHWSQPHVHACTRSVHCGSIPTSARDMYTLQYSAQINHIMQTLCR